MTRRGWLSTSAPTSAFCWLSATAGGYARKGKLQVSSDDMSAEDDVSADAPKPPTEPFRTKLVVLLQELRGSIARRGKRIIGHGGWPQEPIEERPDIQVPPLYAGHLELYSAFRDYVKHEDDLTNNRLNWNFTIQGFLFLSWAYCIQKIAELRIALAAADDAHRKVAAAELRKAIGDIDAGVVIIGWVGLSVSALILLGALGAQVAITLLNRKWESGHEEYKPTSRSKWNANGPHLPGLIGGGNRVAHGLGFGAPILIPICFMVAWLILIGGELWELWGERAMDAMFSVLCRR